MQNVDVAPLRVQRVLELEKPLLDAGWMEGMSTRQPVSAMVV